MYRDRLKKYANLAKQDPGRAKQSRRARAGTNFSQPRTNLIADLCIILSIFHSCEEVESPDDLRDNTWVVIPVKLEHDCRESAPSVTILTEEEQ